MSERRPTYDELVARVAELEAGRREPTRAREEQPVGAEVLRIVLRSAGAEPATA